VRCRSRRFTCSARTLGGEARPDSDVDLCLVAEGASEQLKAAAKFREAMWGIHRAPPFTLIPITPQRLAEKKAVGTIFLTRS